MRWRTTVVGLMTALAFAIGCKQQCFLYECDATDAYRRLGLTPQLENDPTPSIVPSTANVNKPPTVEDSDRPPRYISLAEAIAMALENGDPGIQALNGTVNDDPAIISPAGRLQTASTANPIRVLALNPAIVGTDIEAALSKFDARWETSMTWTTTDQPTQGLSSFQNGDQAVFQTSLLKPLPTGGVTGITFNTTYLNLTQPPTQAGFAFLNPAYTPKLTFQFEQPLLQGYGVEINQLRSTHPGSILTPFNTASRVEGILITRIRLDENRLDFERQVHTMLVNVEAAYWNLYSSYWALYSREQALRQAFEAWRISTTRVQAGRLSIEDEAQTRGQFELFRGQRIAALDDVLEREHQLRAMIGLPVEDGKRLVPIDTPTLAPYEPDWTAAMNEMLALRPGLGQARQDLKFRQLDLISQKNLLLPDLRFTSSITPNGQGDTLSGSKSSLVPQNIIANPNVVPNPSNAFHSLATGDFVNWSLGLRMDVTLGYRDAYAALRAGRLALAQSYLTLRDLEYRYAQFLEQQYRAIFNTYEQIISQRAQREAAARQLEARRQQFLAGKGTLDFLLEAQRLWADALRAEYQSITDYNNALCRFEYAKGTIMQHDNVVIAEGGLPQCAQIRAVEHERERSNALVLRERAKPITVPCCRVEGGTLMGLPELPASDAASVPAVFEGQAALSKIPDKLPSNPNDIPNTKAEGGKTEVPPCTPVSPEPVSAAPVAPISALSGYKPALGTPMPVVQSAAADPTKDLGTYQIPAMPAPPPSKSVTAPVPAPAPAAAPIEFPPQFDAVQWTHGERLQRTRWRESLGDPAPSGN